MSNYDEKLDQQIELEASQTPGSIPPVSRIQNTVFFQVGTVKLAMMCFFSFGFYGLFWIWKNWHYLKQHSNVQCLPWVRTLFSPLWVFSLFRFMIAEIVERGGQRPSLGPGLLATSYIVGNLASRIPGIFGDVLGLFIILPLVMLQQQINALNGGDEHTKNTKFSPLNWVLLVLSGLLWTLSYASTYVFKH